MAPEEPRRVHFLPLTSWEFHKAQRSGQSRAKDNQGREGKAAMDTVIANRRPELEGNLPPLLMVLMELMPRCLGVGDILPF